MKRKARAWRWNSVVAGVLFITATAATSVSQIILEPLLAQGDVLAAFRAVGGSVAVATLFEAMNALASTGIAIALFVILYACNQTAAVAYLGLRAIEGAIGIAAAGMLHGALSEAGGLAALRLHDSLFLMVLIVFSFSTLVLYPTLFRYRLVPSWISLWGLIGGVLLLATCMMILWGSHAMGSLPDMILSLPIAVNEMVLALWLILRGVDTRALD